ncbi:cell division control protein 45 homolog, partial [Contarinia nasturtii]|uniref:cell division control protein 45 homolog n=1 Tax=Contarinia nasturtii TaxID=265458 RepID=UPI0012D3BF7E
MKPFASKGTKGKAKRECKCKANCWHMEIKEESIKQEPDDNAPLIVRLTTSLSTEASVNVKSESESDSEVLRDDVKEEMECDGDCVKKEGDTKKGAGSSKDANDDQGDGGLDNVNGEQHKRRAKVKGPRRAKKKNKTKSTKKPTGKIKKLHR